MKKQHYLLNKLTVFFYAIIAVNLGVFLCLLLESLQKPFLGVPKQFLVVAALLNLAFGALFFFRFLRPYRLIKKVYLLFSKGKVYDELFSANYILFPEHELAMHKFHDLLNKRDAINLSKRQAEYLALQNQINPHFLYNTLEAIRGDALYEGMHSIAETTEALASFFRYTITDVGNLVSLENEIENSQNYFTIQQYRFGDKLEMKLNYPQNEPSLFHLQVPKLTIQPIIENAIFHGLEQITGNGVIQISFETTVTRLFISIMDNGIGIEPERLKKLNDDLELVGVNDIQEEKKKGGGIALRNVSRRIKLLFGDEFGLHLYSTLNYGTNVQIILPKLAKNDILYNQEDMLMESGDCRNEAGSL